MLNLLQSQSTLSHPTHMRVDGGSSCHAFGDKHLFNVLFVRPTDVHFSGGSTFSAAGMGLVPFMFPGFPTLHSLDPAYCTPTYRTNTLSLITINFYSSFHGPSRESLSSCTSCDSQGRTFSVETISKNNIDYVNLRVIKKDQSHPTVPYHFLYSSIMSMI